jgi:hypothetical protein
MERFYVSCPTCGQVFPRTTQSHKKLVSMSLLSLHSKISPVEGQKRLRGATVLVARVAKKIKDTGTQ